MLKIYFDNVLIDEDSYIALTNDYKLFTDSFKLGSVACNSFKLSATKSAVSTQPQNVLIEDDNTTFPLVVDMIEEDKNFYIYSLTDKLTNFNFNYDASGLIREKQENEEICYLSDIWHHMCSQAGVEYDEEYEFINDIEVSWYDGTIQARKYLSYIAQLQGGYATILPNGKQSFKPYKKESSKAIDIDTCSDFILGEKKTISRVVYDNGVNFWAFGDDEGSTIYIDPSNVFVISEDIIENIYDLIEGFEFYLVDVPQCPVDSSVRAGDIITFTDGTNDYPTIAQYSISYNGGWVGGYKLQVKTDKQEETSLTGIQNNVLKVQSEVDRANATITLVSQQTEGNTSNISTLQNTVGGFNQTVQKVNEIEDKTNTIETTIDGMQQTIKYSGGNNLWTNCVKQFGNGAYTGTFPNYTDDDIKNNSVTQSGIKFMNGTDGVILQKPNGTYNLAIKCKKYIELAECKVIVNNEEIVLDSTSWEEKDVAIVVSSGVIEISLQGDTDNSAIIVDCRITVGSEKQPYSQNPNEISEAGTEIGGGTARFYNNSSDIQLLIDNDDVGFQKRSTGEMKTSFDDKGMFTGIVRAEEAQVGSLQIKEHIIDGDTQVFFSM